MGATWPRHNRPWSITTDEYLELKGYVTLEQIVALAEEYRTIYIPGHRKEIERKVRWADGEENKEIRERYLRSAQYHRDDIAILERFVQDLDKKIEEMQCSHS
jgi:predicted mannosyl-3-phosphoglycerate phosphatase (HAD superfamily)